MKLKYKKVIFMTAISTMGIGIITFAISQAQPRTDILSKKSAKVVQVAAVDETATTNIYSDDITEIAVTEAAIPTLSPTPSPVPTQIPVYDLEKDAYPEIKTLFEKYFEAKGVADRDTLKSLLSDPTQIESQEKLQEKTEYIEAYSNIVPYTKKGIEKGTYIVYVYHEIKFISINTVAPGLSKYYVITDDNGDLKIYSDELDADLKAYIDDRETDDDVIALYLMTNKKSDKAKAKDEDLRTFWQNIDQMAGKTETESATDTKPESESETKTNKETTTE